MRKSLGGHTKIGAVLQFPERLTIGLKPLSGESPPLADVYLRLDLHARGKVIANLSLGLTDPGGNLSIARADLESGLARHIARFNAPTEDRLLDLTLTAHVVVLGGRSFDRMVQRRAELGLDSVEQDWVARAANTRLAGEVAPVQLMSQATLVTIVVASRGGVNSEQLRQHAMSFQSASLASGALLALWLLGSGPQFRFARVVLPVALAWLVYEAWWRWRHHADRSRFEVGAP